MRTAGGQCLGRPPARRQRAGRQALPGPEAGPRAAGLHLADDQRAPVSQHEVELAEARAQPAGETPPALPEQPPFRPALAGQREQVGGTVPRAEQPAGRDEEQQAPEESRILARAAGRSQAWLGTLSGVAGAAGSLSMVWIAWRANFSRTLSATCSVTTSSVSCTTVP